MYVRNHVAGAVYVWLATRCNHSGCTSRMHPTHWVCVVTWCVCGLHFKIQSRTFSVCNSLPLHNSSCKSCTSCNTPTCNLALHGRFAPSHIIVSLWHTPISIAPIPHYCVPLAQTSCTTAVAMRVSLWHEPVVLLPLLCFIPHMSDCTPPFQVSLDPSQHSMLAYIL